MKKMYNKPAVHVELITMDQPIAANCDMDKQDMEDLIAFGYFGVELTCDWTLLPNGGFDYNGDNEPDSHDTVCYHSNIQKAFLS